MSDTTTATPSDQLDQELEEAQTGEAPVLLTQGTNVPGIGEQLDRSTRPPQGGEQQPDKPTQPEPPKPATNTTTQADKPTDDDAGDKPDSTVTDRLSKSLERQLARMLGANKSSTQPSNLETPPKREPYKPLDLDNVNPEEGVDLNQVKQDRERLAAEARDQGREEGARGAVNEITPLMERQQFVNQLEFDKRDVFEKHPQLNPNKEDTFDPEVTNAINQVYFAVIGLKTDPNSGNIVDIKNPGIRYADFVDAALGIAEHIAADKAAQAAQNVAKQASQAGIRPTTGRGGKPSYVGKTPAEMNDKEWEGGGREYWNQQAMSALGM